MVASKLFMAALGLVMLHLMPQAIDASATAGRRPSSGPSSAAAGSPPLSRRSSFKRPGSPDKSQKTDKSEKSDESLNFELSKNRRDLKLISPDVYYARIVAAHEDEDGGQTQRRIELMQARIAAAFIDKSNANDLPNDDLPNDERLPYNTMPTFLARIAAAFIDKSNERRIPYNTMPTFLALDEPVNTLEEPKKTPDESKPKRTEPEKTPDESKPKPKRTGFPYEITIPDAPFDLKLIHDHHKIPLRDIAYYRLVPEAKEVLKKRGKEVRKKHGKGVRKSVYRAELRAELKPDPEERSPRGVTPVEVAKDTARLTLTKITPAGVAKLLDSNASALSEIIGSAIKGAQDSVKTEPSHVEFDSDSAEQLDLTHFPAEVKVPGGKTLTLVEGTVETFEIDGIMTGMTGMTGPKNQKSQTAYYVAMRARI